ncbi:Uncharacterised protein [Bordetella pertussis]|nr:Uncharacterised protein [Bordetella pertussis]
MTGRCSSPTPSTASTTPPRERSRTSPSSTFMVPTKLATKRLTG